MKVNSPQLSVHFTTLHDSSVFLSGLVSLLLSVLFGSLKDHIAYVFTNDQWVWHTHKLRSSSWLSPNSMCLSNLHLSVITFHPLSVIKWVENVNLCPNTNEVNSLMFPVCVCVCVYEAVYIKTCVCHDVIVINNRFNRLNLSDICFLPRQGFKHNTYWFYVCFNHILIKTSVCDELKFFNTAWVHTDTVEGSEYSEPGWLMMTFSRHLFSN